jgi:tripartite-type tricarboxylate transporter receptor subunit TctC
MNVNFYPITFRLLKSNKLLLNLLLSLWLQNASSAQEAKFQASLDWPIKTVRIVVPFAPGGGTDYVARITAQKLTERYSQTFLIENRPGAGGITGTDLIAKSKPDGYNFVIVSGSHTINPILYKHLPYDTKKDFFPVSNLVMGPGILVINTNLPFSNLRELIVFAKNHPGELSFASSGNGSPPHLGGELFKAMAGINLVHIPYKGNGPAYNDVIGGQVSIMFPNIATALPYVRAGKLKALAVTSRLRSKIAPEIPTMNEAGLDGYELASWFGMLAPAETSSSIIFSLQQEIFKIYQTQEIREKLLSQGVEPLASSPSEFAGQINSEMDYWAKTFKSKNLKIDP